MAASQSSSTGESPRESQKVDISRILDLGRAELQQLNIDRIFKELEKKNVLPKGTTSVMAQKTASQKSNVLTQALQRRSEQDFQAFLEICADENERLFQGPTENFLSMVSVHPGYEKWDNKGVCQVPEGMFTCSSYLLNRVWHALCS